MERPAQRAYQGGFGLLVATNQRLIFVDKGLIYGIRAEDFPCEKITSIEYQAGILFGDITIHASGNRARIEQVDKRQAAAFADFVRARTTPVFIVLRRMVPVQPRRTCRVKAGATGSPADRGRPDRPGVHRPEAPDTGRLMGRGRQEAPGPEGSGSAARSGRSGPD